jgi:hypothetical protein
VIARNVARGIEQRYTLTDPPEMFWGSDWGLRHIRART